VLDLVELRSFGLSPHSHELNKCGSIVADFFDIGDVVNNCILFLYIEFTAVAGFGVGSDQFFDDVFDGELFIGQEEALEGRIVNLAFQFHGAFLSFLEEIFKEGIFHAVGSRSDNFIINLII
jgi:hypothetical protein